MHGEYKPPRGKLVAAEVEVVGERLARVQISGDFFLEPDDALDRVNAALTGIPVTEDASVVTPGSQPRSAATPCWPGSRRGR